MPKPHPRPKPMPTVDTNTDTDTAADTDTVDTVMVDTDVDTIGVELLLKQTNNNPLNYNCQDQVTRYTLNLATMQKNSLPFFENLKIPSFFQLNSNPNLMFTILKLFVSV